MIQGIHHPALMVRDLAAAARYYCAAAGMQRLSGDAAAAFAPALEGMAGAGGLRFKLALLAGRNGYLLLAAPHWPPGAPAAQDNPINRAGFRHFCAQNFDCAVLAKAVAAGGGSLIAPPLDLGTGNQYAYARDGEGNIMEIEGLPYVPPAEPTWLGHMALVTRDMGRAATFYAALLGRGVKHRSRVGPGVQFDTMGGLRNAQLEGAWLPAGNLQLELWQFHAPPSPPEAAPRQLFDPGYSHLCLESDDLAADTALLARLGGAIVGEVVEAGGLRAQFGRDGEGNLLQLIELSGTARALAIAALADSEASLRIEAGQ